MTYLARRKQPQQRRQRIGSQLNTLAQQSCSEKLPESLIVRAGRPPVIGELRELARAHAPEAIKELARLAVKAKSELARISAIRELLDRGFGKPTQFLAGDSEIIPKGATLEQLREDILIEFAASFPDLEIVPKKRLTMIAGTDEAN